MDNLNEPFSLQDFSDANEWQSLMRPHLLKIKPYSSARDDYKGAADIWLDANELPYGRFLNRYPDPHANELKKLIAKIKAWEISNFLLGNGSDECIELLLKLFCEPGKDEIMICPPTYGMYKVSAQINNVKVIEVLLTPDFQLQVDEILHNATDKTKIIFICTPNNPTGNLIERGSILRLLREFKGIVVIDEAYVDFGGKESWTSFVHQFPRLIVLQTLSKSAGLAGLRVGICFAQSDIIERLYSIKPPYNLSGVTQLISFMELKHYKRKSKLWAKINSAKASLINSLDKFDSVVKIYPSDANFLLVKVKDADYFYKILAERGIVVRNRSGEALCEDCLRISIGKKAENKRLMKVWKSIDASFRKSIPSEFKEEMK